MKFHVLVISFALISSQWFVQAKNSTYPCTEGDMPTGDISADSVIYGNLSDKNVISGDRTSHDNELSGDHSDVADISGNRSDEVDVSGNRSDEVDVSGDRSDDVADVSGDRSDDVADVSGDRSDDVADVSGDRSDDAADVSGDRSDEADVSGDRSDEVDVSGDRSGVADVLGDRSDEVEVSGDRSDEVEVSGDRSDEVEVSGDRSDEVEVSGDRSDEVQVSGDRSDEVEVSGVFVRTFLGKEREPVNRCSLQPFPCSLGETCKDEGGKVMCGRPSCVPNNPCANGECIETPNGYRCVCRIGYSGIHCDEVVKAGTCLPNPCKGDCRCVESCQHEFGYYCISTSKGFMGKDCTVPVPRIRCGQRSIIVDIPQALYQEFDKGVGNTIISVSENPRIRSPEACIAKLNGDIYTVNIPLPFSECGTRRKERDSSLSVSNRIYLKRNTPLFDMSIPIIDFSCKYTREYNVMTSLTPVETKPELIEGNGEFTPVVSLCKVSACQSACPAQFQVVKSAVYTVGEMIHLRVSTKKIRVLGLVASIDRMYLSCGSASDTLEIINDGCGVQKLLPSTTSSLGAYACVSFQTPRVLSCNTVYIHLHVLFCTPDKLQPCSGSTGKRCTSWRGKRSTGSMEAFAKVGPILLLKGKDGTEKIILFPESTVGESATKANVPAPHASVPRIPIPLTPDAPEGKWLALITVVSLTVLAILIFFLLIWYCTSRHSSCRGCWTSGKKYDANMSCNLGKSMLKQDQMSSLSRRSEIRPPVFTGVN